MNCVNCGRKATKGSMKHPYCKECFKKEWNNNYHDYNEWLNQTHPKHSLTLTNKEIIIFFTIMLLFITICVGLILLLAQLLTKVIL